MTTYLSEKFKQLRKNRDLTQEQVADIFDVTSQTVSRWETGTNMPDIGLLPHIAIFFKVTVDELLGTEVVLGEQKVSEYKRDIRNLLNIGKADKAIEMARIALKEYPVNYYLQNLLVQALCTVDAETFKQEIIAVSERVMEYCPDPNICLDAKFQLFNQYVEWDMKEEAEKILVTLPSEAWYTQDVNAGSVLEGEEWLQNQQLQIVRFTILLCDFIKGYARKADLDTLQRIKWYKAAMQIEALTDSMRDDGGDSVERAFRHLDVAELYCEAGDIENALTCVEKATQNAMKHLNIMYKTESLFDVVRGTERFVACFELLRANSGALKH
ncbi:MAG: helix-turn-helix domain-containing protein [Oscillospiraceae bacterium]|nr:helix-turn-helix domain-containing protein [Oscillospiraceae bacterium]